MLALLLAALAAPQLRTLDSLPNLGPGFGRHSVAYALNDAGEAGGAAQGAIQDTRPVIWRDGLLVELGIIPGDLEGVVLGLNNSGSACGQSIGVSDIHAVLWSGGSVTDLGNLGVPVASATALNDAGVVVGNAYPLGGTLTHAFRWDPATGAMTDLGTLGGDYSAAACVDAAGHAYGVAASASQMQCAVQWPVGGGAAIRLDGQNRLDLTSIARGCSAGGLVVGDGYGSALGLRGFVWSAARGFNLLPNPPGTTILQVRDVNDAGLVVVFGADARIWIHDLTNGAWFDAGADLPPFPRASLASANQINASGQIAGGGVDLATGVSPSAWLLALAPHGLGLGEPFPGVAGVANALGAAGAAPGATLYLLAGFSSGAAGVPGCGSLTVGIQAPRLLGAAAADAQGVAQWLGLRANPSLAGLRVLLQAVELSNCRASNLSSVDFR